MPVERIKDEWQKKVIQDKYINEMQYLMTKTK